MILSDVMQQLADQLDTIEGLRVHGFPPDSIHPPAAVVTYPGTYSYDSTYGRGSDTVELPIVVLVGKVSDRASRDRLSQYVNGSGPASIKAVAEAGTYSAFDSVRITGAEFDVITVAGVEHLAATLTAHIVGKGQL